MPFPLSATASTAAGRTAPRPATTGTSSRVQTVAGPRRRRPAGNRPPLHGRQVAVDPAAAPLGGGVITAAAARRRPRGAAAGASVRRTRQAAAGAQSRPPRTSPPRQLDAAARPDDPCPQVESPPARPEHLDGHPADQGVVARVAASKPDRAGHSGGRRAGARRPRGRSCARSPGNGLAEGHEEGVHVPDPRLEPMQAITLTSYGDPPSSPSPSSSTPCRDPARCCSTSPRPPSTGPTSCSGAASTRRRPAPRPIPASSAPGTVAALGAGVAGWQVGDRVCALLSGGGYGDEGGRARRSAAPGARPGCRSWRPPRCRRWRARSGATSSSSPRCSPARCCSCTAARRASARWPCSSARTPARG